MNLPACRPVLPSLIYRPVDPSLLASYHAVLDAVAACPFYDEERAELCREAGDWELAVFRELGFTPHFDRKSSPRPSHGPDGVALRPGALMTVATTAVHVSGLPEVADSYVLVGAHVAAEGLPNNVHLYRLLDPEHGMWERLETTDGVPRQVEPSRRPCMACDARAEFKLDLGDVALELCRECYRPLVPVELLDLAHRGQSTFFGNEALLERFGPRAPGLRAALEDLAARIRARAATRGDAAISTGDARLIQALDPS